MPFTSIDPCFPTIEIYSKDVKNSLPNDYVTDLSKNPRSIVKYDSLLNTTKTFPTCFLFFKMEEVSLAPSLGPLAQLVEQLAFNQLVPRSSRGRPTKKWGS